MKKLFLIAVISLSALNAKNNISKNVEQDNAVKVPYWEVTKGDKKFYLFGTLHIKDKRVVPLQKKLKELISKVDAVNTEIPLDPISKMAAMKMSMSKEPLTKVLPKELQKDLDSFLKDINPIFSIETFDRFKIWAVTASLSIMKSEFKNPEANMGLESLDEYIFKESFVQKKKVAGIETLQEQIDIFDKTTVDEQIDMLKDTLRELKENPDTLEKMVNYYFNGETSKLLELNDKSLSRSKFKNKEEFYDKLLYQRNIKMTQRLVKRVNDSKKRYLFAFGQMHFLGKKSILELLEKDGYKIEKKSF